MAGHFALVDYRSNLMLQQAQAVTATLVPEADRLSILPRLFGRHMTAVESAVFNWMRRYSPNYSGGFWNFHTLSNGGFYMSLETDQLLRIQTPNGFDLPVSADTAGVIATSYALNALVWKYQESELLQDRYYQLIAFAKSHADYSLIMAAID